MARISDEDLSKIVDGYGVTLIDDGVCFTQSIPPSVHELLQELQTLRRIVGVIDDFIKVGESEYCYITSPKCGCMWCRIIPLLKERDAL